MSLIKWLPFLRSINQTYKISPPNSWHWFISFRLAKLWMHPVYIYREEKLSSFAEVVDQKRITNRAKETQNVREKWKKEKVREEWEKRRGTGTGVKPEREREKPDSAPPYATTCIDRGLCHWIPPVVGRFLSLC